MKKGTKLTLAVASVALGAVVLAGCTKSFCSQADQARMKYAFEPGISVIAGTDADQSITFTRDDGKTYKINHCQYVVADWVLNDTDPHYGKYILNYTEKTFDDEGNLVDNDVNKPLFYFNNMLINSNDSGYVTPDGSTKEYFMRFDYLAWHTLFTTAIDRYELDNVVIDLLDKDSKAEFEHDVAYYSYTRFCNGNKEKAYTNWNSFDTQARVAITVTSPLYGVSLFTNTDVLSPDACPSSDFIKYYQSALTSYVTNYRTCLTLYRDKYGSYGYAAKEGVFIDKKTWGDAWSKGLFEGLLVYPIGALVDVMVNGFKGTGVSNGVAAFLAIIFVTFIIRGIMLLLTFKQTQSNAKMTELQPEIQKIQNKYPNSNTSKVEKQRMAEEMNRLYKKNKVNPFMTLIVLVVQFPVFICVWGALSGSAQLTNGTILGLNLSHTIRQVLTTGTYWTAAGGYAAVTALFLFLLMAGAQTVSMLLPQWIQKKKAKDVAKLGKNPAQKSQNNKMKWFTYIMLALIIFMGFSLVSAMGIYWFVGAIFSIVQTLIMQLISNRKKKNA